MREGGCLCGAIRYKVIGEPTASGICHCRTCRKVASAPSLPFVTFSIAHFTTIRGTLLEFQSSPLVTRGFCGVCGSPLTYRTLAYATDIDVMTGSLDDPEAFPPTFHAWMSEKLSWDHVSDRLTAYATSKASGEPA